MVDAPAASDAMRTETVEAVVVVVHGPDAKNESGTGDAPPVVARRSDAPAARRPAVRSAAALNTNDAGWFWVGCAVGLVTTKHRRVR